ncbi:hypothetical protein [Sphingobacterium deserti]|uniref:Uncharacterized protein n=1 Tax=Sphingobacterium deserti TaxID=1229276 RepID=A0A0B8T217_9SPHI|nr:hypothetical protein [Sphingobacterium deserti]KGE15202.1 hypothetical protein DI53_0883 [Sphingobacterium deserti]
MYFKFFIALTFLVLSTAMGHGQEQSKQDRDFSLIDSFLTDVDDASVRPDVILSKHVLIEKTDTDEGYDYLEASISEIRLNVQSKELNEIEAIPFRELPKKETRDIDPEGKSTDDMYFLFYKGRQMLALYLKENKIASFTLVSKGNNVAHFVTY